MSDVTSNKPDITHVQTPINRNIKSITLLYKHESVIIFLEKKTNCSRMEILVSSRNLCHLMMHHHRVAVYSERENETYETYIQVERYLIRISNSNLSSYSKASFS